MSETTTGTLTNPRTCCPLPCSISQSTSLRNHPHFIANDWSWNGTFKLHAVLEWFSCLPWCLFCYGNSWYINIASRGFGTENNESWWEEAVLSSLICKLINTHTVWLSGSQPCGLQQTLTSLDGCSLLLTEGFLVWGHVFNGSRIILGSGLQRADSERNMSPSHLMVYYPYCAFHNVQISIVNMIL